MLVGVQNFEPLHFLTVAIEFIIFPCPGIVYDISGMGSEIICYLI